MLQFTRTICVRSTLMRQDEEPCQGMDAIGLMASSRDYCEDVA
jgi:hypothetical protein